MPRLVIGNYFFLARGDDFVFLLEARLQLLDRIEEIFLADGCLIVTGSIRAALLQRLADICSGESRCLFGEEIR